ncbi:MAG TPA: hypothetical protein VN493_08220 [Thermoanaerobaculia bacterium]|nr:hypothetical protein [Thermoanaerobaculia bacterium]
MKTVIVLLAAVLLQAAPPSLPQSRLICEVPARKVLLSELGLPEGSRPRDVVLTRGTIWVLFEPALLVGMPRQAGELDEVEMVYGAKGDPWETLSVSPRDGSLWIVSPSATRLWHKPPLGRVRPVRLPQAREGGFRDLVAGWDGIYLAPSSCGGNGVWRVDASGKLLGTGLRRTDGACPPVALEADWSGRIRALLPETGESFLLSTGDRWAPAASTGPWPERAGPFGSWFFWGEEPIGSGGERETVLVRGTEPFREDCGEGNRLLRVAGDSRGWAALTRDWLLLGEHAVESRD